MLNFTSKTISRICLGLLGAVSARADCWIYPDDNGLVNITNVLQRYGVTDIEDLPDGVSTDTDIEDIPDSAFKSCENLKAVIISASVTKLGSNAFSGAFNLNKVTFEKGSLLEVIGDKAFDSSSSLKNITFPANLKQIGHHAFQQSGLEEVTFEERSHPLLVGKHAFKASEYLKSINIPPEIKIGNAAFEGTGCRDDRIFTPGAWIVNCEIVSFR